MAERAAYFSPYYIPDIDPIPDDRRPAVYPVVALGDYA